MNCIRTNINPGRIGAIFLKIFSAFMPVPEVDAQFKLRPFYAILQDGLNRMFDVVKSDEFRFL
jgi:hypothetical protein